jgi:hypothetical protein
MDLNALVERYGARLPGLIRMLAPGIRDPDDLAQQVWVRAAESVAKGNGPRPGREWPWLSKIAGRTVSHGLADQSPVPIEGPELASRERDPADEALARIERREGLGRFLVVPLIKQLIGYAREEWYAWCGYFSGGGWQIGDTSEELNEDLLRVCMVGGWVWDPGRYTWEDSRGRGDLLWMLWRPRPLPSHVYWDFASSEGRLTLLGSLPARDMVPLFLEWKGQPASIARQLRDYLHSVPETERNPHRRLGAWRMVGNPRRDRVFIDVWVCPVARAPQRALDVWQQLRGWWVPRTGVYNFQCRFGLDGRGEPSFWLEPHWLQAALRRASGSGGAKQKIQPPEKE